MNNIYGIKIIEAVHEIEAQGLDIVTRVTKKGKVYSFGDKRYKVEIIIDPPKWLGLEFVLAGSRLWYPINTDLYDVTKPENAAFVVSKESEIVKFLNDLSGGHIKIARSKHGPMLLIPERNKYALLKQGRFFASKSMYDSEGKAKLKGEFNTFPLKIC